MSSFVHRILLAASPKPAWTLVARRCMSGCRHSCSSSGCRAGRVCSQLTFDFDLFMYSAALYWCFDCSPNRCCWCCSPQAAASCRHTAVVRCRNHLTLPWGCPLARLAPSPWQHLPAPATSSILFGATGNVSRLSLLYPWLCFAIIVIDYLALLALKLFNYYIIVSAL